MLTKSSITTLCIALTLLGCAGSKREAQEPTPVAPAPQPQVVAQPQPVEPPPPAAPAVVDDGRPVDVHLRVEALNAEGFTTFLNENGRLHSGDKIALYVQVSDTAHVYLAAASAKGDPSILFPGGDEPAIVAKGQDLRIPGGTKWLMLDKETGREDLFVYASKRELSRAEVEKRVAEDVAAARKRAEAAKKKKPQPKKAPTAQNQDTGSGALAMNDPTNITDEEDRGLSVVDDAEATPTAKGDVTRKHFAIRHSK